MKTFRERHPTLNKFKADLESVIEERDSMEACLEEVISDLEHDGTAETALGIIKLYDGLEIVDSYLND